MRIKWIFVIIVIGLFCDNIAFAGECPLIFLHGHKSSAKPSGSDGGWTTWNDSHAVMMKIIAEQYGGYTAGSPRECDESTLLSSTGCETPKIYNFSYYHPDGNPGVISLSEESVRVYFAHVYDGLGRKIDFIATSPPASYDSTGYWSRCVPGVYWDTIDGVPHLRAKDVTRDYVRSWKVGKFAKRLADFIDKVLTATGASQVDIVAHSMGGLVARAAIKNYGCDSKVRKLLTIGTMNQG